MHEDRGKTKPRKDKTIRDHRNQRFPAATKLYLIKIFLRMSVPIPISVTIRLSHVAFFGFRFKLQKKKKKKLVVKHYYNISPKIKQLTGQSYEPSAMVPRNEERN
jgi:hypothetical protein